MIEFIEHPFDSAYEFLKALRLSEPHWNIGAERLQRWGRTDPEWHRDWIFRGHGSKKWSLMPSAWREDNEDEASPLSMLRNMLKENPSFALPIAERIDKYVWVGRETLNRLPDDELLLTRKRIKAFILQACAEVQMINEFIDLSDELGFAVAPLPDWARNLSDFVSVYMQKYAPDIPFEPPDEVNELWKHSSIALAKHHNIPTRLLDWTRSPLIAAFFAAISVPEKSDPSDEIVVFAIHEMMLQRHIKRIVVPAHENDYLRMQLGVFTYDSKAEEQYLENGKYPSLEESLKLHPGLPLKVYYPRKYTLPISCVSELLRLLWLERTTQAHLMPTLDNVAQTVVMRVRLANGSNSQLAEDK